MRASSRGGASSCTPTGRPSAPVPNGTLMAGWPASGDGMVHTSFMYMANGSSTFAPSGKATDGVVGASKRSYCA